MRHWATRDGDSIQTTQPYKEFFPYDPKVETQQYMGTDETLGYAGRVLSVEGVQPTQDYLFFGCPVHVVLDFDDDEAPTQPDPRAAEVVRAAAATMGPGPPPLADTDMAAANVPTRANGAGSSGAKEIVEFTTDASIDVSTKTIVASRAVWAASALAGS